MLLIAESLNAWIQIVMLQSNLLMGGRSDGADRYRDWRLDIDSMSYEVRQVPINVILVFISFSFTCRKFDEYTIFVV